MAIINSEIKRNKSPEYCNILELNEHHFNIPNYQRAYSWKKENIEDLVDSVVEVINSADNKNLNYIGNILISKNKGKYDIIDGQQRITTMFLMIKAILDIFEELVTSPEAVHITESDKNEIKESYNIKELSSIIYSTSSASAFGMGNNEKKIRIEHSNQNEKKKFANGMNGKGKEENNNYLKNYLLLKKIIKDYIQDDSIQEKINNLYMLKTVVTQNTVLLVIDVPEVDTAFSIFESLNTKGLQLTAFDLVNGNIENSKQKISKENFESYMQNRDILIDSTWKEDDILLYYLQAKVDAKISKNKIYGEVKKLLDNDINETIKNISHVFETINNIEDYLYNEYNMMTLLKRKQIYPIIFGLSLKSDKPTFTDEMKNIIDFAIKFSIIDLNVKLNSPGGEFKNIMLEIIQYIREENNIDNITLINIKKLKLVENYLSVLSIQKEEISNVEDSVKKVLLLYLLNKENTSIKILYPLLHLEHVLPQKPEKWIKDNPSAWTGDLEKYIHSIGNMTILNEKLNRQQSNLPLGDKKTKMEEAKSDEFLKNSRFNKVDYSSFDKEYILTREQELLEAVASTVLNVK